MRKVSFFLLVAVFFLGFYIVSCKKDTYETKFKPMPYINFDAGDSLVINMDKDENPEVSGNVTSTVGLNKVIIAVVRLVDGDTIYDVVSRDSVFSDPLKFSFKFTPKWGSDVKAIGISTSDTRGKGYSRYLITTVSVSPAPKVKFMATSLDVNLNKGETPAITGTITSALGLVSVKYFVLEGTKETQIGTEETSFADNTNFSFSQTPSYSYSITGFKVVATDRKGQETKQTLELTISPVSITYDAEKIDIDMRKLENIAITCKVTSDASLSTIEVYRLDSIITTKSRSLVTTKVKTIDPAGASTYSVNITDFPYTTTVIGCKIVAKDQSGAENKKVLNIYPTNEDSKLSVYRDTLFTQSQRASKPFSFSTVDGKKFELNNEDTLAIDGKRNSDKIDFLIYCGTSAASGFNIWAPGGDEPAAGIDPCGAQALSGSTAGALLWKNVYKIPSGCSSGSCCTDNLWPTRRKTTFAITTMTPDEFLTATSVEVLAAQETPTGSTTAVYSTGYIKGEVFPKIVSFKTEDGKKGLLYLKSYNTPNPSNPKDNTIVFSVKVMK